MKHFVLTSLVLRTFLTIIFFFNLEILAYKVGNIFDKFFDKKRDVSRNEKSFFYISNCAHKLFPETIQIYNIQLNFLDSLNYKIEGSATIFCTILNLNEPCAYNFDTLATLVVHLNFESFSHRILCLLLSNGTRFSDRIFTD